jgi:hypothetical protein
MNKFLLDSCVAAGLALALLLVIALDKFVFSSGPTSQTGGVTLEGEPVIHVSKAPPPKPLRIAVTPTHEDNLGKWDDMTKLLDTLGAGYKYTVYPLRDLPDAKKLAEFDVLFYTCAPGGTDSATTENLRNWVGKGGTLYASDWRYESVALAFPDYNVKALEGMGKPQRVEAKVLDAGLSELLGRPTISLRFDLSKWKVAAFGGERVKVLIEGDYVKEKDAGAGVAPLLVKFQFGKGTVIFTSFHNEKQTNEVEQKLLKYLVFSVVTARTEADVAQTMLKGGFSPQKSNLLSASPESPKVTKTYQNKKAGHLRFVLGFENRGARLKLTVTSPNGKKFEQEGTSTISMDFNNAQVGDWQYTVTAEVIPFPDFPFTLTVGESAAKK